MDYDRVEVQFLNFGIRFDNFRDGQKQSLNGFFIIRRCSPETVQEPGRPDFPHKDLRRARAAALSMIPTTTGADRAVSLVLPELSGKLNGLAIRVPTPNVSIVDLVANIEKTGVTVSDVNSVLKEASEKSLS